MSDQWNGIVEEFMVAKSKEVVDATVKGNPFLNKLVKAGRVVLGSDIGYQRDIPVKYKNPPVQSADDSTVTQFIRRDCYKHVSFETRGHQASDLLGRKEYWALKNGGQHVIVNRFRQTVPNLIKAVRDAIAVSLFTDAAATGNENKFHGIPTVVNGYTACAASDRIAVPNGTYLGLSTALAQAGSWTTDLGAAGYHNATLATDYPDGHGAGSDLSFQYKFWSPLLVNKASTGWGSGSTDWKVNGPTIVRRMMLWLHLLNDNDATDYFGVFGSSLFADLKESIEAKVLITAPAREGLDSGVPGNSIVYDGLTITTDASCPTNKAYVTNVATTKLEFITSKMIETRGPIQLASGGWGVEAESYGNAMYTPFQTAAIADFTS